MHKKSTLFIILLLALLLIVSGCGEKKKKGPSVGFIGGQDGLIGTLEIISSEPNTVLDNNVEPFQIVLNLENQGEHTVNSGEVISTLSGIDINAFQIAEKNGVSKNLDQLDKRSIEGKQELPISKTQIVYEANYKYDEPVSKTQDLGVNYCYKYNTLATADACLKKNVIKSTTEAKCKVNEQKVVGNSGAPVSVTLLTQKPSITNQLTFFLEITNLGTGDVYSQDFLSNNLCTENREFKDKLNVKLSFPDNNPKIKCSKLNDGNEGTLKMVQNKAVVTCTADTSDLQDSEFTRSLRVSIGYVYKDDVSTQITVKSAT